MKNLLSVALECYSRGNLPQAELVCQSIIRKNRGNVTKATRLLGMICLSTGNYRSAVKFLNNQGSENDRFAKLARLHLERSNEMRNLRKTKSLALEQFILIKAWGYGFWSDIDHVLGQLLVAEISGRTPIVHWGDNSLFQSTTGENAFLNFFEPVTSYSIDDLSSDNYSFFPKKWTSKNLKKNNVNKWGKGARVAGFFFLERNEDVVVSDFHTYLFDLISWIPRGHQLFGETTQSIYRKLAQKYLIPKPHLTQQADEFFEKRLSGKTTIAVHIRGSDKVRESINLAKTNESYFDAVDRLISKHPNAQIFLLTDDQNQFQKFTSKFGPLVCATACRRTSTGKGIHHSADISGRNLGEEVMLDVLIAAKCDFFVGNGASNVSTSILHMKDWPSEKVVLLDRNYLLQEHFSLHKW